MLLHVLCVIPRNLLDDFHVLDDWSLLKRLAEGSRADRPDARSMASTTLIYECVTISDHGHSLRVIHVHGTVERLSRCSMVVGTHFADPRTHKPDAMLHLHRRLLASTGAEHPAFGMRSRDRAPLHLELAGPVRQLADAYVRAVLPQRLADESSASLSLR